MDDVHFNCTLALHMTNVIRKQGLEVRRRIHTEDREFALYRQAALDLGTIWKEITPAERPIFMERYGHLLQPMLNRLTELKDSNTPKRKKVMQLAYDIIEEIIYHITILQTRDIDISFPGIKLVHA